MKQISLLWILKYNRDIKLFLLILLHSVRYNSLIFSACKMQKKIALHFKNIFVLTYYNIDLHDLMIRNFNAMSVHFVRIKSKTKKSLCRNLYDFHGVESKKFMRLRKQSFSSSYYSDCWSHELFKALHRPWRRTWGEIVLFLSFAWIIPFAPISSNAYKGPLYGRRSRLHAFLTIIS